MTALKVLKDKNGTLIYPITHIRAVRDNAGNSVESLLQSLQSDVYIVLSSISERPEASSSTLGKIYLVPNSNEYDRYITSYDGSVYSWVQLGSTAVTLTDYIPKTDGLLLGDIVETL